LTPPDASDDAYCGLQLYVHFKELAARSKRKLSPRDYTVNVTRPPRAEDFEESAASTSNTLASDPSLTEPTATRRVPSEGSTPRYIFGTATPPSNVIDLTSSSPPRARKAALADSSAVDADSSETPHVRPANMRAYKLWHQTGMGLDAMCGALRSPINPLKRTTVMCVPWFVYLAPLSALTVSTARTS